MKSHLFNSSLALLALCTVVNLHAEKNPAASSRSIGEIPVSQVMATTAVNGDTVTAGTSRILVSMRLGSPSAVLTDGSWLYTGFRAMQYDSDSGPAGTLVVRFAANKVTSLSLASEAAAVALRQSPRASAKVQILAANEKR